MQHKLLQVRGQNLVPCWKSIIRYSDKTDLDLWNPVVVFNTHTRRWTIEALQGSTVENLDQGAMVCLKQSVNRELHVNPVKQVF